MEWLLILCPNHSKSSILTFCSNQSSPHVKCMRINVQWSNLFSVFSICHLVFWKSWPSHSQLRPGYKMLIYLSVIMAGRCTAHLKTFSFLQDHRIGSVWEVTTRCPLPIEIAGRDHPQNEWLDMHCFIFCLACPLSALRRDG